MAQKPKSFQELMEAKRMAARVAKAFKSEQFASGEFLADAVQQGVEKRIKALVGGSKVVDGKARTYLQGKKFDSAPVETPKGTKAKRSKGTKAPKGTKVQTDSASA